MAYQGKGFFTGSYGLVIEPDHNTAEKAKQLAYSLMPRAAFLAEKPHITLYHANFTRLPENETFKTLQVIRVLEGRSLKLRDLQIFGGRFLFWNIIKTEQLQQAHEQTLRLSKYLDQDSQARALQENLSLNQREMDSLKKFGHPLMKDLYLPHITLAYDPKGITLPQGHETEEFDITVSRVNFAEIGQFGVVKNIVEL